MKKLIKNKYIYIFIMVLFISLSFMNKGYSSEIENPKLVECEKSSAYLEWEKLSDEEKVKVPMPSICDKTKNNKQYYSFAFEAKGVLPSTYVNKNTKVKDQESTGQCWAFATTTAIESYIKKQDNLTYTFSPRHIEYSSTREFLNNQINDYGYDRSLGSGGHFYMSSNYLVNGYGPISENEMPFENNENKIDINAIKNKTTLVDVNDVVLNYNDEVGVKCTAPQIQEIKELIYKNGAVLTTTFMTEEKTYYSVNNSAYYYNGNEDINHAITLIGWDDNYSRSNFSSQTRPSSNGVWIVQNSYGTTFGKNGYYYISYEDVHICDFYMSIDEVDYEVEDNSYVLDKLGFNYFLGYQDAKKSYTTGYAMNVFTKEKKKENLKEITFATNGSGNYTIYYKAGKATENTTISTMTKIGSGRVEYAGYVTHKLEKELLIDANTTNFSIAIYYDMDTSTMPIPISAAVSPLYKNITTSSGVSFISSNGSSWEDLHKRKTPGIASIKAFTDNVDFTFKIDGYNVNYNTNTLLTINTKASNVDLNELAIYVTDSNNNTVKPISTSYINGSSLSQIEISLTSPVNASLYNIKIYYKDKLVGELTVEVAGQNSITSNIYTINQTNRLIYVKPKTDVSTFFTNIINAEGDIYKDSTKVTLGYVSTGMTIDNYIIIVKGDVSSDGEITPLDYISVKNHIMGSSIITEKALVSAADYNSDGSISPLDYVEIKNYIMNGG